MPFNSPPLIYICNRTLSTGTFPTHLKFSQVLPIFGEGNSVATFETSAYRLISLLTSFSKIFEKGSYNTLLQHTKGNDTITSDQG
jgi:hypothetical protein